MDAAVACIGGIAAQNLLADRDAIDKTVDAMSTPYGESQPLHHCKLRTGGFWFLSRFGLQDAPVAPHAINYRANLYALKETGVKSVVAWNDVKAISHNYRVGEFVLVADLIDETVTPPLSFHDTLDAANVRQWPVFCPTLRHDLATALREANCEFNDRGVYVCVEGHRQDTPAEVRKYATFGGDLIGRALAPEAFLTKELGLSYASISYVASYAESGSSARPFERGQVLEEGVQERRVVAAVEQLPRVMERLLEVMTNNGRAASTSIGENVAAIAALAGQPQAAPRISSPLR